MMALILFERKTCSTLFPHNVTGALDQAQLNGSQGSVLQSTSVVTGSKTVGKLVP
jgi:hypothetical protein